MLSYCQRNDAECSAACVMHCFAAYILQKGILMLPVMWLMLHTTSGTTCRSVC